VTSHTQLILSSLYFSARMGKWFDSQETAFLESSIEYWDMIKTAKQCKDEVPRKLRFLEDWLLIAATLCAFFGFSVLLTALDGEPLLKQTDPLLGLSARLTLLIAALFFFGLSAYLFAGRNRMNKGIALLWMGLNFLVYGFGIYWIQRSGPCAIVVLTGWRLGIWPATLNLIWEIFIGLLIAGGVLVLILERQLLRLAVTPASAPAIKTR
jgi:hypothetical protein